MEFREGNSKKKGKINLSLDQKNNHLANRETKNKKENC